MRSRLAIALLFILGLLPLRAANGDYVGAFVPTNGWDLVLRFASDGAYTSNGTTRFNFLTNNVPSPSNTVVMTMMDGGFSNTISVGWTFTNYGCSRILRPGAGGVPAQYEELEGSGFLDVRISLSEWVYRDTTNLLLYLTNGFYVQNGITNAVAWAVPVTNLSVQLYQPPDFTCLSERWARWTNAVETMRFAASHGECEDGRLVDSVQAITHDASGNTNSYVATNMTKNLSFPDIRNWGAYYLFITNSAFNNLDVLRTDIIVRAKRGTNVFDTRDNLYTGTTTTNAALPQSITNQCDKNNTIATMQRIAVVSLAGTNANGLLTNSRPQDMSPANYFAGIRGACVALAGTNGDVGGGFIYLMPGVSNYVGAGAGSIGGIPKSVVTILPYPGTDLGTGLTNSNTDDELTDRIRFVNVPFGPGSTFMHANTEYLEFKGCRIDTPSAGFIFTSPLVLMHFCAITNLANTQSSKGLRAQSTENTSFYIISCNLDGFNGDIALRTFWGNQRTNGLTTHLRAATDVSAGQLPSNEHIYVGNNLMLGLGDNAAGTAIFTVCPNRTIHKGFTQINDVWELCTNINGTTFNYVSLGASATNIKIFNVDMHGKRVADMVSSTGAGPDWRIHCYVRNSRFGNTGWKDWNDVTTNAARIGPQSVFYGVGCSGNLYVECNTTGVESPGSFNPEFPGLYSYHPAGSGTNVVEATGVVAYKAWGSQIGIGGGDYHPAPAFPGYKEASPFDIEGTLRTGKTAGAFEAASSAAAPSRKKALRGFRL